MIDRNIKDTSPPDGVILEQATEQELVDAILSPNAKGCFIDSSFSGLPEQGAVFNVPLQGFPTEGNSFAVLSNGIAALTPGVATTFESQSLGGVTLPAGDPQGSPDGFASFDVVTLTLRFRVPQNPGVLSVDWKFGSEENPSTLGSVFEDYFRADVTTSGGTTNIALLPDNNPVTLDYAASFSNAPGGTNSNPTPPFPTPNDVVYNAVTTNIYTATFDLTGFEGEIITLALRVADASDRIVNSAAFIDNVNITGCRTRGFSLF